MDRHFHRNDKIKNISTFYGAVTLDKQKKRDNLLILIQFFSIGWDAVRRTGVHPRHHHDNRKTTQI